MQPLLDLVRQLLWVLGIAAVIGLLGLLWLHRRLRHLDVPDGASFATTLRMVPFSLVVFLDLLDFGLDFFSAPVVWIFLSRYNLQSLRNFSVVEDLIPFTGPIPTLSLAWIGVRLLGLGDPVLPANVIDADEVEPGRFVSRTGK